MYKEEIAAHERRFEAAKKIQMARGYGLGQLPYQLNLLGGVRVERGLDAVGHQGLQTAKLFPARKLGRIAENLEKIGLVVALEEHCFAQAASFNKQVERRAGVRSTIDVVAKVDLDRAPDRTARQIGLDQGKDFLKQVGTSVDVAHCINANSIGQPSLSRNPA